MGGMYMNITMILKWMTGIFEAFLGIPFVGGLFIIGNGWAPLGVMLVLHIVTLVFSVKYMQNRYGSILGIITSLLGWIPFVGMGLHIATAICLIYDAAKPKTVYR